MGVEHLLLEYVSNIVASHLHIVMLINILEKALRLTHSNLNTLFKLSHA